MTPYCSGLPIESIPAVDPLNPDTPRQRQVYQIIVSCINWLENCTCPDIPPALTFLASYISAPHPQQYKVAVHTFKYLTITNEYGISFHSQSSSTIQAFNHFPRHHDKEAYTEATTPSLSECHQLKAFYNGKRGGQFGNVVKDGTPLEIFKFFSLSGFLTY